MNARNFLVRGLLAGLVAGLFAFLVGYAVGEPAIDKAIALEEAAPAAHASTDGHAHTHGEEAAEGGISRGTQKTWGLATATVAVGVALGGIVSLLAAGLAGRLGRLSVVGSTGLVTALAFVAYALVPFLKYPAAPPAVGSGDTIGSRTAYYFLFVLVSVLAMAAAVTLARRLVDRSGGYPAVLAGTVLYVAVVAVAAVAMPTVNEIGGFPADVLWEFRVSALLTQVALWGGLGFALTALLRQLEAAEVQGRPGVAEVAGVA